MKRHIYLVLLFAFLFNFTPRMEAHENLFSHISEKNMDEANLLLSEMLDGVGLFTILGDFKPMSSIKLKSLSYLYQLPQNATDAEERRRLIIKKVEELSPLLREMSGGPLYFSFAPIIPNIPVPNANYKAMIMPELLIFRKDITKKTILRYDSFFQSIGINSSKDFIADLEVFLFKKDAANENNRTRAFGYLFGYPDYAIDFYINASNKKTVNKQKPIITTSKNDRNFVRIPVYGKGNNYSYAIPKNNKPKSEDVEIMNRANSTLEKYKQRKEEMQNSPFNAILFIKNWYDEK